MAERDKFIISSGKTKREIALPISICGSWNSLHQLGSQILKELGEEDSFSYGWVDINKSFRTPSGPPEPWE